MSLKGVSVRCDQTESSSVNVAVREARLNCSAWALARHLAAQLCKRSGGESRDVVVYFWSNESAEQTSVCVVQRFPSLSLSQEGSGSSAIGFIVADFLCEQSDDKFRRFRVIHVYLGKFSY